MAGVDLVLIGEFEKRMAEIRALSPAPNGADRLVTELAGLVMLAALRSSWSVNALLRMPVEDVRRLAGEGR